MKPKQIIIGIVAAVAVGTGFYFIFKSHGGTLPSEADEESVSTVVSVQVGQIKRMTLHRYVTGYGTVEAAPATANEPAAAAPLAASTAGVVAKVNVVEGQHVEKGQVLVSLNSGTATAEYAAQELARQKELYAEHNTSLKALQDAEVQWSLLQVTAPLSGTVVSLNVKPGAAVDVNTVVAEVVDMKRLAVRTEVPEFEASQLQGGQPVQVLTRPPVDATLFFVNPAVNINNGTVVAWSALPSNSGLHPGQFVPLQIVTAVRTNCLAAPEESVVTDVAGHSVIALVHGDEATQTPVQTGFRENGWVEITGSGLKVGNTVVTVGAYGLPDKTQIQVVNSPADETSVTNSASSQAQ